MRYLNLVFFATLSSYGQTITLSGAVSEKYSKETLPDVGIRNLRDRTACMSNAYGFYSISLIANDSARLQFSHLGHRTLIVEILAIRDTSINVELEPVSFQLGEVAVEATVTEDNTLHFKQIGADVIRQSPALLGEKDVLKTIQLMPGIQRGVEGSNAFYVRGGGADQNLVILDDATVYNANHLFGFVSIFNPDAVKSVNFYKGSFPARYGGRISSVTDIQMKEGHREAISAQGGIGILSGRLTVEGPLINKKSSFLISARRSFVDLVAGPFMPKDDQLRYRFFDVNTKANLDLNKNNRIYFSGYIGGDKLATFEKVVRQQSAVESEAGLGWRNLNGSVRWNHIFSDKIFSNISLISSNYSFSLTDTYRRSGANANYAHSNFSSTINDITVKNDVDFFLNNNHNLKSGFAYTLHKLVPRKYYTVDEELSSEETSVTEYHNYEAALYLEDSWQISRKVSAIYGMRFVRFATKKTNYSVAEPRAHVYYSFTDEIKLNAGYARTNQFLHLLSNTGVGLPTDLWVPVTSAAPPQQGDQVSAGVSKSFTKSGLHVSLETYRRSIRNILTYKQGSVFLDTDEPSQSFQWENNVVVGNGESYGTEVLVEKKSGRLQGWAAYTLAWVAHQFDSINNGKKYFPKYDSRHNVVLFCNFRVSEKLRISASWLFSTGNAMTIPQAYYYADFTTGNNDFPVVQPDGSFTYVPMEKIRQAPYTGSVNSFRADNYHRLDLCVQFYKKKKQFERYWEVGIYNAYNRQNPYYYYLEQSNDFVNRGQRYDLKKKSLFPVLPSISYNFKFR